MQIDLILHDWPPGHTSASGCRLFPAFDMLPNSGENSTHIFRFVNNKSPPTREVLLVLSGSYDLNTRQVADIPDNVVLAEIDGCSVFGDCQVSEKDVKRLPGDIEVRLRWVRKPKSGAGSTVIIAWRTGVKFS